MTQNTHAPASKVRIGRYAFLTIFILGLVWALFFRQSAQGPGKRKGGTPTVSVTTIAPEEILAFLELPARVSPYRQAQIRPQVDGIIIKRLFEEGARVQKGDQLYQIDDARYKAVMHKALADFSSAKAKVTSIKAKAKRYSELVKINAVSQQDYEDVQANLDQAKAAVAVAQALVDVAEVNINYSKVYAPISGRIGKSTITEGALVTANQQQALAVITQLDPVYVDMQQSGARATSLRAQLGQKEYLPVKLLLDQLGMPAYEYKGKLKFSEVTISESTSSVALRALFPNPEAVLLPGLFVRATVELGERSVLIVPQRATVRAASGNLVVWVVNTEGKASPRNITATQIYKDGWIVEDGLKAGETIVVAGYHRLKPNVSVTTEPWRPESDEKKPTLSEGK